jgi:hypothetical protein
MVCDKQGTKLFKIKINEFAPVPLCPYNVLSASKRQKQGWTLVGLNDYVHLEKDGVK